MNYININTGCGFDKITFPDSQTHVNISEYNSPFFSVTCSIKTSQDLFLLAQVSDALHNLNCTKVELHIPYLMGARYDRIINKGDSFDLKIIANIINQCRFEEVFLYDVHSETSLLLINNSINVDVTETFSKFKDKEIVLICPDLGASKKIEKYLSVFNNVSDVVYCLKKRDLKTGKPTINVLEKHKCENQDCLIIDDICDGGGTFIGIAQQITPSKLYLSVTHGIFSKGFDELNNYFDEIICTDSFIESSSNKKTSIINLFNK